MMAVVDIGALLEYSRQQGVLRRTDGLGQLDRNPAAIARKAQADDRMVVDGGKRRRSSDMEAVHAQSP